MVSAISPYHLSRPYPSLIYVLFILVLSSLVFIYVCCILVHCSSFSSFHILSSGMIFSYDSSSTFFHWLYRNVPVNHFMKLVSLPFPFMALTRTRIIGCLSAVTFFSAAIIIHGIAWETRFFLCVSRSNFFLLCSHYILARCILIIYYNSMWIHGLRREKHNNHVKE